MTREEKKKAVERKTKELISQSAQYMRRNLKRVLRYRVFDIDSYEDDYILPRIILQALLKEESFNYHLRNRDHDKVIDRIFNSL